jgi:electron transfer flavoprotein alpha subunit
MAGPMWVVAELSPEGGLARLSTEVATLARELAEAAGTEAVGVVVGADPGAAAEELAAYLPRVLAVADAGADGVAWATAAGEAVAGLVADPPGGAAPAFILAGASPDGRDLAGVLSALTGLGVLVNATAARWDPEAGPIVEMSVFGGKLTTESAFSGDRGIVTLRPNAVTASHSGARGGVEQVELPGEARLPRVTVVERVSEAGAAVPIEEARIIVSGGRGVGGPDGFGLVEEIATALGGSVGATRAVVDAGWVPFSQQIGQTGKIVKPQLYLALGISGAIQHKVGMQTADTIVAVNRDADAPIAEFADLLVIGDLFEFGPALLDELRSRSG